MNTPDKPFVFPPSFQSMLFGYLNPDQQERVKPMLRVLKKSAQVELCTSLLDYLETGKPVLPRSGNPLSAIFLFLTSEGLDSDVEDEKGIIKPLHEN